MIDVKLPRQFIACACIAAVIIYGGFCLFFDYNAEVFKWLFPALNFYPLWFFGARQWEKRKNGNVEVQAISMKIDAVIADTEDIQAWLGTAGSGVKKRKQ